MIQEPGGWLLGVGSTHHDARMHQLDLSIGLMQCPKRLSLIRPTFALELDCRQG